MRTQSRDAQKIEASAGWFVGLRLSARRAWPCPSPCAATITPSNPAATADYINAYRDMWDGGSEENQHGQDFSRGEFTTMKRLAVMGIRKAGGQAMKPGYKQTEVGAIPEDWEVKPLGELGRFRNGINEDEQAFGRGSPFVSLVDVLVQAASSLSMD
ncbi:hypothetical protein MASR1M90_08600 [Desulfovibrionales bacterium]